jgi:hypothetical protein
MEHMYVLVVVKSFLAVQPNMTQDLAGLLFGMP